MGLFPILSASDTTHLKTRGSFHIMVLVAQGIVSGNGLLANRVLCPKMLQASDGEQQGVYLTNLCSSSYKATRI